MDFEIEWLLLLPIFFVLGWLAARAENKKEMAQMRQLPRAYFKGLNYLLNNQKDQAIESLIDVAKVDTDSVDLYFSLAHLFAQRGEIARAIKVYQNLLERDDLDFLVKNSALFKLGLVFLQGGLFDRAEESFHFLRQTELHEQALSQLLKIYQSQQEWDSSIEIAVEMKISSETTLALVHFHCERAMIALERKDILISGQAIDVALTLIPDHVRSLLLKSRWYRLQDRLVESLALLKNLAAVQSSALPLLLNDLIESYELLKDQKLAVTYLYEQALNTGSVDVLKSWLFMQEKYGDTRLTNKKLDDIFLKHPSLNALNRVLEQRLLSDVLSENSEKSKEYEVIQGLIRKQVTQLSRYRCSFCGFEAAQYYWQCPACTRWETYPPKRIEELGSSTRTRAQVNGY